MTRALLFACGVQVTPKAESVPLFIHDLQAAGFHAHQRVVAGDLGLATNRPLDRLSEHLVLVLKLLHLAAEVEDDLDAGEVHPEITRQGENRLELLTRGVIVQARVAT